MWPDAASAMRNLDQMVRAGRITGWGFEQSIAYLVARRPTMSYRMYRGHQDDDANLGAFLREVAPVGARVQVSEAQGSVGAGAGWGPATGVTERAAETLEDGVWRSRQVVLTISFRSEAQLRGAAELVARRFTRGVGSDHRPGSWWVPDARVSGTLNCPPGMVAARAHSRRVRDGHVVVLSAGAAAPFPGARTHRLFLPEPFGAFLGA